MITLINLEQEDEQGSLLYVDLGFDPYWASEAQRMMQKPHDEGGGVGYHWSHSYRCPPPGGSSWHVEA